MISIRRASVIAAVASLAIVAGASGARTDVSPPGDIPDNQLFIRFGGVGYSFEVPEGWPRTGAGTSVTFADKYNSIRADVSRMSRRPTVRSVATTDVPRLRATVKGFSDPSVSAVTRSSGTAILVRYRARSAPSAVTGRSVTNDVERYAFWKNGRLVVLTLQAPKGSDNVDPWRLVTDSFAWSK